ncbi:MAG: hypothetical protein ACREXS_06425 [Gammaproteobacteria bacterium]
MRDVTKHLYEYLEAKRHLWNTYFRFKAKALRECSALDQYEQIDKLLFSGLVVHELKLLDQSLFDDVVRTPWMFLRVVPRTGLQTLRMWICDPITGSNRKWNAPELVELKGDVDFGFVEFFEWNRYDYVTYPYLRVTIDERSKLPAVAGREALMEVMNGRVFYSERSLADAKHSASL